MVKPEKYRNKSERRKKNPSELETYFRFINRFFFVVVENSAWIILIFRRKKIISFQLDQEIYEEKKSEMKKKFSNWCFELCSPVTCTRFSSYLVSSHLVRLFVGLFVHQSQSMSLACLPVADLLSVCGVCDLSLTGPVRPRRLTFWSNPPCLTGESQCQSLFSWYSDCIVFSTTLSQYQ